MDCSKVRAEVPAYQSGNLADADAERVGQHLAQCEACMADARDDQSALALLKALPEITACDDVWRNLARETAPKAVPTRRAGALLGLIRLAAAASLLVAALSFVFIATVPRPTHAADVSFVAPDATVVRPGTRIMTGQPFRAPTYVVLTVPDAGLLRLSRGTEISFDDPHRVHLIKGEVFAEVTRGFVVRSHDAIVTVQGTRFGVRADSAPSTIYVVEGRVDVAAGAQKLALEAGRMATVGGAPGQLDEERLGWLAQHERIQLALEPPRPSSFVLGDAPTWRFAFRTTSSAPLPLEPLKELHEQLYLKIVNADRKEYVARLGSGVSGVEGGVRLDVMTPCVLSYRVDPALFPMRGRYTVTLVYQGRQGVLTSEPRQIEVR